MSAYQTYSDAELLAFLHKGDAAAFTLANLFGDVPMVLTTDYKISSRQPRMPQAAVYQQVVKDLEEARIALSSDYAVPDRSRPNKWTASALLARAYLYLKEWDKAEQYATQVLSSGIYSLVDLNSVFDLASNETIWQVYPIGISSYNSAEGKIFIPFSSTAIPLFSLTA